MRIPTLLRNCFQAFLLLSVMAIASACRPSFFFRTYPYASHLREAEEYTRQGEIEKAIESYQAHIQDRLDTKRKPDWENPYFYHLIIGDLHIQQGDVEEALKNYELAESQGVHAGLVSDRYRFAALWHEEKGEFDEALEILSRYADRDELIFNLARDRVARKKAKIEDAAYHQGLLYGPANQSFAEESEIAPALD